MSAKHKKTVKSEVTGVEIDSRLRLPNSHGLASLTLTSPREFLQPSSDNSVKGSNQGSSRSTGETRQKAQRSHGCKGISWVNPEKLNEMDLHLFRKTRAKETGFSKEFMSVEKELATHHSKQLVNAVGILNANKELFINLLENPNSLLVDQTENFQDSRAKNKKTKHFHAEKSAQFHAKESEASYVKPVEEDDPRPLRNLAPLKPSPLTRQDSVQRLSLCSFLHYHSTFVRSRQRSRPASFSIGNFKRKIMQVLKLGRKHAEEYGKEIVIETLRRTSSSGSYLDDGLRQDPKKRDKTTHDINKGASATQSYGSHKINSEDKQPVSDSPIKVTAEMEFYLSRNDIRVLETPPCEQNKKKTDDLQTHCTKSNVAEDLSPETNFIEDEFISKGSEIIRRVCMSSAVNDTDNIDLRQRIHASNISRENGNLDSMDSLILVRSLDTSSPRRRQKENGYQMIDGENWQSQDHYLSDASAREVFEFDELPVQALKVGMEEHSSSPTRLMMELHGNVTMLDGHRTISECIKALVLALRFPCEELAVKCRLFDRMNVLTFLDLLKLLHNQLCGDCRLLADYISEILEDLRECYEEHNVNAKKAMFHKVTKWVSRQFAQQLLPMTWEDLAKENMMRSQTWKDSPADVEAIVIETTKCVLEELIMESTNNI